MITWLIWAILVVILIFDIVIAATIRTTRTTMSRLMAIAPTPEQRADRSYCEIAVLYDQCAQYPFLTEYVVYCAIDFLYPFGAMAYAKLSSLSQILCIIVAIVYPAHGSWQLSTAAIVLFFLTGLAGSRVNRPLLMKLGLDHITRISMNNSLSPQTYDFRRNREELDMIVRHQINAKVMEAVNADYETVQGG